MRKQFVEAGVAVDRAGLVQVPGDLQRSFVPPNLLPYVCGTLILAARFNLLFELAGGTAASGAGDATGSLLRRRRPREQSARRWVGLQPFVGDGHSTADRATIGAVVDPPESTIERRKPVPEGGGHGVVDALCGQGLRGIGDVTGLGFGLMVLSLGRPAPLNEQAVGILGAIGRPPRSIQAPTCAWR